MKRAPAILALLALAITSACGSGAGGDVRANERLLALARPYPGAVEISRQSAPYYPKSGDLVPPLGHTTVVSYRLPRHVPPQAVVAYYVRELTGWNHTTRLASCRRGATPSLTACAGFVDFRRGRAVVELQLAGLAAAAGPASSARSYSVAVDHDRRL
jgi:hypothetical protein